MGRYDRYWEMREGSKKESREIFRCTDCGAVTAPANGHNGAPDPHRCAPGCKCHTEDWQPGGASSAYKQNFDRIFPNAPGAGV